MGKLRLTTAQALVKFLDNQYLEVDGVELKFVKGIFAIFGHGNVLGLGQALEQDSGDMRVYQGRNEQGWPTRPPVLPARPCAGRLSPAPPPSVQGRPT